MLTPLESVSSTNMRTYKLFVTCVFALLISLHLLQQNQTDHIYKPYLDEKVITLNRIDYQIQGMCFSTGINVFHSRFTSEIYFREEGEFWMYQIDDYVIKSSPTGRIDVDGNDWNTIIMEISKDGQVIGFVSGEIGGNFYLIITESGERVATVDRNSVYAYQNHQLLGLLPEISSISMIPYQIFDCYIWTMVEILVLFVLMGGLFLMLIC